MRANNKANTCLDPSDEVCAVPSGTGILVLAADDNVVEHNHVTGNNSFGIAIANFCIANGLGDSACGALGIEPNADDTTVQFNDVTGNGAAPDPSLPSIFAVDLAWDTTGTNNCWRTNVADTTFPPNLPSCD